MYKKAINGTKIKLMIKVRIGDGSPVKLGKIVIDKRVIIGYIKHQTSNANFHFLGCNGLFIQINLCKHKIKK